MEKIVIKLQINSMRTQQTFGLTDKDGPSQMAATKTNYQLSVSVALPHRNSTYKCPFALQSQCQHQHRLSSLGQSVQKYN